MKIVVFTGAGISQESGIKTFRDSQSGLWNTESIEEVATPSAWRKNRQKVLNFYNERRKELRMVKPNIAHKVLVDMESDYDVTIITQNVDDLHERAGSTEVIHLHGELTKARGSFYDGKCSILDENTIRDIGYDSIEIGDMCTYSGSQLRPHIVWFDETPFNVDIAKKRIESADVLIIIGTSLSITYTVKLLLNVKSSAKIFYVDPDPALSLHRDKEVTYITKKASEGIVQVYDALLQYTATGEWKI